MSGKERSPASALALGLLALLEVAALALVLAQLEELPFDASTEVLLAADERSRGNVAALAGLLDGNTLVGVALRHRDLFSDAGSAALRALCRDLEALPLVLDVKSLTHSGRPVRREISLDPRKFLGSEPFLPPPPRTDWERVRAVALSHPLARDLFVSRDGNWALVLAVADAPPNSAAGVALRERFLAALAPQRSAFEECHLLAFPFLEAELLAAVRSHLRDVVLAAVGLVVGILLVTFRSPSIVVVLLAFEALGLSFLALLFRVDGAAVNLYTGMLIPLVAGIQLTFLVHVGAAWRSARSAGLSARAALGQALDVTYRPSLFAALTTVAGLASLLACDSPPVAAFGRLGALAVAGTFVLTFLPLRLVRQVSCAELPAPSPGAIARRLAAAVTRRPRTVVAAFGILVLAALPGVPAIRTDARAIEFLDRDSASRTALEVLDEHLGGINVFLLDVDSGRPDGIHDAGVLHFMEDLRRRAESLPGVTAAYTYSQLLVLLNRMWHDEAPESDRLPEDPALLGLFRAALRFSRFPLLDALRDVDGRRATFVLRTRDMPAIRYLALLDALLAAGEELRPPGAVLVPRRGVHTLLAAERTLLAGQARSLALCALGVAAALMLVLRSPRLVLIVLLSHLPPLALGAGLLGLLDLPLNSVTVMVGSVVLGIAVDDSFHWLDALRAERARGANLETAVAAALARKLRPMAATTAILMAALGLLGLAPFPPVAHFGLLSAAALLVALLSVTLPLPALLILTGGARGRPRA